MATYNGGLDGVNFVVDCTNSITGTYPNVKHIINYKIYLALDSAYIHPSRLTSQMNYFLAALRSSRMRARSMAASTAEKRQPQ